MWIKYIVLTILLLNSVNCARKQPADDYKDKEKIKETLEGVRIQLNALSKNRLEKYTLDANKLGLLCDALEDLSEESVKILMLLLDSEASSCLEQIGKVGVNAADCTISDDEIKFYVTYRGSLNNVDELTKLVEALEYVEANLLTFKTQLLDQRQDRFRSYIENVQQQKEATKTLLEVEQAHYKKAQLNLYMDDVKNTLDSIESEINDLVSTSTHQQNALERDKDKVTDKLSEAVHSNANYTAQFVCDAEINGDTNALKKYLDLDDISDQRKLLDKMLQDLIDRVSGESLDSESTVAVGELLVRIDKDTKHLISLIEENHNQQLNLLSAFQDALQSHDVEKQSEILKQITNLKEAAQAIRKIYAETKNLEEALAACYRFERFEAVVAGLLELNNTNGVKLTKSFEDLVYDNMLERLKLNFNGEKFCCHSGGLLHAVYLNHPKVAIQISIKMQRALDASKFYIGEQNWRNEVIIFLYNNVKLALKNACSQDVYKPIFTKGYVKYFRRVLAYIEVIRILEPQDLKLFEMTGNLRQLMLAYWKDPQHLESINVCNEHKAK